MAFWRFLSGQSEDNFRRLYFICLLFQQIVYMSEDILKKQEDKYEFWQKIL